MAAPGNTTSQYCLMGNSAGNMTVTKTVSQSVQQTLTDYLDKLQLIKALPLHSGIEHWTQ